jgi:hypothetical protein
VTGLKPDTVYHFATRAQDMAGNVGAVSNDVVERTLDDATPPVTCDTGSDSLSITSGDGLSPNAHTKLASLSFNWTAACDDQSTVVYRYALNDDADYVVLPSDVQTADPTVTFLNLDAGSYVLHVAAFSGGGQSRTSSFPFVVGEAQLDAETIRALNDQVKLRVRHQNGINNVTWTLPADLPGPLESVEVWRRDAGVPKLIATIHGDASVLGNHSFSDITVRTDPVTGEQVYEGTTSSEYRVNMVFATQQRQEDSSLLTDKFQKVQGFEGATPLWVWLVIGIAIALLAAGIIIFVLLGRKRKQVQLGDVAYAWESADPNALPVDPATGLPIHPVKCPTCSTTFQAIGMTPLGITCPNCGTSGTLE